MLLDETILTLFIELKLCDHVVYPAEKFLYYGKMNTPVHFAKSLTSQGCLPHEHVFCNHALLTQGGV